MTTLDDLNNFTKQTRLPVVAVILSDLKNANVMLRAAKELSSSRVQPVIVSCHDDPECDLPTSIPAFTIEPNSLNNMQNIAVVLATDTHHYTYPLKSRVLWVVHAFVPIDENGTADSYAIYGSCLRKADALFIPHPVSAAISGNDYRESLCAVTPSCMKERDGDFTVIPGGYPKLDLLMELHSNSRRLRSSILVMPTIKRHHGENYKQYCTEMIEAACSAIENVEGVTVTFRTHPGDRIRGIPEINEIEKAYSGNDKVVIDRNASNADAFLNAITMVTDASLGRVTFSIGTGRPHITYQRSDDDLKIADSGFSAHSTEQIVTAIKRIMKQNDSWDEHIARFRKKVLLNPGHAFRILSDSVEALAHRETRDYWIPFERNFAEGDWENPEEWHELIRRAPAIEQISLKNHATKLFPDDLRFRGKNVFPVKYGMRIDYDSGSYTSLNEKDVNDFFVNADGSPEYAIWGCSNNYFAHYQKMVRTAPEQFLGFLDSNESLWGTRFDSSPVHPPKDLLRLQPRVVFLATYAKEQVRDMIQVMLREGLASKT